MAHIVSTGEGNLCSGAANSSVGVGRGSIVRVADRKRMFHRETVKIKVPNDN